MKNIKKTIGILILGILLISSVNAIGVNKENDTSKMSIYVTFSKLAMKSTTVSEQEYLEISTEGALGTINIDGKPLIPQQVKTIEFPFGTKIIDISCEIDDMESISLFQKILPAPKPIISGMKTESVIIMDESIYQSDEFYPNDWYKISTGGGLNCENQQKTFVTVQMFPVRYNPVANIVLYAKDMTINIQYQEPKKPLLTPEDEYDMVVIAPSMFLDDLQPLIDHKNKIGVKSFLKTTEEIYNEYNGFDKPEQIKYFIKDAKEKNNVTYALLVGGLKSYLYGNPREDANQGSKHWHLPVRYTNLVESGTFFDPGFLSDLYYMDIYDAEGNFSSWDSNGDGIYAKWSYFGGNRDIIDFYPDVYVGRLACRNKFEVKTVVKKIINYESKPINPDWYKRIVMVAGDSFDDSFYGTNWPEDELICDMFLSYMQDFVPVKLYASNKDSDPTHTPLTSNIIREINTGCGFLVFAGHGCPYSWNTNWPGEFNSTIQNGGISIFDFLKIWNLNKLPICCIEGGCHNSMFNVSLITTWLDKDNSHHMMTFGVPTPECLGWTFVRKPFGGSIANFGYPSCTYLSPGENGDLDGDGVNEPDIFEALRPYMVRQYYKLIGEGAEFLGEVAGGAVRNYLFAFPGMGNQYDAKIIEQVIFFGDPSLKIGGYELTIKSRLLEK
jgi:hypothetical protein